MTLNLPDEMADPNLGFIRAQYSAHDISLNAYAAYWSPGSRDHLTERVHAEFAVLAEALGYRIEKIAAAAGDTLTANHQHQRT